MLNLDYKNFKYFYEEIKLDSLVDLIRILKINKDNTWDHIKNRYLHIENSEYDEIIKKAKEIWDDNRVRPWNAVDAFKLTNQELKYKILSLIGPEEIQKVIEPKLIDRKVIIKKQPRYKISGKKSHKVTEVFKKEELIEEIHEFEDIYELYLIDKNKLNTPEDICYVKCKDTSTDRIYYLYVDSSDSRCNSDAISAIAWTMRFPNGEPFTKEDYLNLYSEA